jgi:hypothetical protein
LIGELAKDRRVIPLAFHVDYWNQLGWRDPFSSPQWSARQAAYDGGNVYTPQIVVNGEIQMVGSDRGAVTRAIEQASREKSDATLELAGGVARGSAKRALDLYGVVVQNAPPTAVKAGENSGRTMRNDAIVRELKKLGRVNGAFSVPAGNANVVFLQDPATRRIAAAASRP